MTQIKKVAIFSDFFNSLGGTEYYNALLAEKLLQRGIEVKVFVGERPRLDHWPQKLAEHGIQISAPNEFHDDKSSRDIERHFVTDVANALHTWRPDVIHSHPAGKFLLSWFELEGRPDTPVAVTEWTTPSEMTSHWFQPGMQAHKDKIGAYIATCDAVKQGIRNYHKYDGPIYSIPHLIPDPELSETNNTKPNSYSVGCISRLSVEKGLDFLVGAWKKVAFAIPEASLHIYGHGPDEQRLQELARCVGVADNVHLEGTFKPVTGINEVTQKHSFFVQPSLFESIPTSAIELIARGKAMVASCVGGLPELLEYEKKFCGRIVNPADTQGLATAIIDMCSNPELVDAFGKNARRKFEDRYDIEKVLDNIIDVYQGLAEHGPRVG